MHWFNKIYKVLPQDIICILNDDNIIKEKYCELKNIYNFKDYLNQEENKNYKISIIYTFSYLSNTIEGLNKELSFFISGIKSEKDFIWNFVLLNSRTNMSYGNSIFPVKRKRILSDEGDVFTMFGTRNVFDKTYNSIDSLEKHE